MSCLIEKGSLVSSSIMHLSLRLCILKRNDFANIINYFSVSLTLSLIIVVIVVLFSLIIVFIAVFLSFFILFSSFFQDELVNW